MKNLKNFHPVAVCLLLLISFKSFSQVNMTQGLVAYYPFTGNALDASGFGNNPTSNTAVLTADRFGNPNSAYRFNGTSSSIGIPNSVSLNSMVNQKQISLCAWVRPAGYYTGTCYNNMIISKGTEDYINGNYFLRFSDVVNGCTNPTTTGEQFYSLNLVAPTPTVQLNQWYSVVCTADNDSVRIYVNCVLRNTAALPSATNFGGTTAAVYLGRMLNTNYPYWFNGDMDEVRIYNRRLTQDEVNVYGGCAAPPASCDDVCNWKLLGNNNVTSANFIGPINSADFKIRTNNTQRAVVKADGKFGINTDVPAKTLEVNGEVRVTVLPPAVTNDRMVFANAAGDLHAQVILGGKEQFLRGDGTFQNISDINLADKRVNDILDRLAKVEAELAALKSSNPVLTQQLPNTNIELKSGTANVLFQNAPNPFNENTVITYNIPFAYRNAQIVFTATSGQVIRTVELKQGDKGTITVSAKDLSSGLYTYSLMVDGRLVETKKMVKQ